MIAIKNVIRIDRTMIGYARPAVRITMKTLSGLRPAPGHPRFRDHRLPPHFSDSVPSRNTRHPCPYTGIPDSGYGQRSISIPLIFSYTFFCVMIGQSW